MSNTVNDATTAAADLRPIRERIIESADRCFRRYGVAKTTIEDIAADVGVSRATVYRYVSGGREEILLTVMTEEARRQVLSLLEQFEDLDGLEETLTAVMTEIVFSNRENDRLSVLFNAESLSIGSALPGATDLLLSGTLEMLGPFLSAARDAGEVRTDLTDPEIAEFLLRITMSLLAFDGDASKSREATRRFIASLVVPAITP